jgi:ketosteroid isomerase-like protein
VSEQNVESMRRLLGSYVKGDYGAAIEALDPDVELWLDPQTFPESGLFAGATPSSPGWQRWSPPLPTTGRPLRELN